MIRIGSMDLTHFIAGGNYTIEVFRKYIAWVDWCYAFYLILAGCSLGFPRLRSIRIVCR